MPQLTFSPSYSSHGEEAQTTRTPVPGITLLAAYAKCCHSDPSASGVPTFTKSFRSLFLTEIPPMRLTSCEKNCVWR